jgi:hypothetical protein
MPTCVFCSNPANSEEHLWPKWVHERKDFGPIKRTQGDNPSTVVPHPQITVRAVCRTCNNGWMSQELEVPNIPLIANMMQDISMRLDREQQQTVATWCMKMAFLIDWTRRGGRTNRFYTRDEALAFAKDLTIPPRTHIWIGHMVTSHLSVDGHDFSVNLMDGTRIGTSSVTTVVVGHFVAQVVTDHLFPEHKDRNPYISPAPGPWATKLIRIWPIEKEWFMWPPPASFINGGHEGFAYLLRRWRTGDKADTSLL